MAIASITEHRFGMFNVVKNPIIPVTEKAWFASGNNALLGIVIFDRLDSDFNHVVFGRHNNGEYRYVDGQSCFETEAEAQTDLVQKMTELEKTGKTVYP